MEVALNKTGMTFSFMNKKKYFINIQRLLNDVHTWHV